MSVRRLSQLVHKCVLWLELFNVLIQMEVEKSFWNELDHNSHNQTTSANSDAKQVLIDSKRRAFDGSSSNLNQYNLDSDGHDFNDDEERVVEEIVEDVKLLIFDLSCVDLIENLHEDKCIEDHSEKDSIFKSPSFVMLSCWNAKDGISKEK